MPRAGPAGRFSGFWGRAEIRRLSEPAGPADRRVRHRHRRDWCPTSNRCRSRKTRISWNRSLEQREVAVFQKIQSRDERLGGTPERLSFDRENRLRGRENHRQRIAILIVEMEFVMEVRAAGPAGLPDVTDDFTLDNTAARPHPSREISQMCIVRTVSPEVPEHDEVSVAVAPSRERYDTVPGRLYPCSGRCSIVDSSMRAPLLENRMAAHAESRGDARELEIRHAPPSDFPGVAHASRSRL